MEINDGMFDILMQDENYRIIMKRLLEAAIRESFSSVIISAAGPGYPIVYVNPAFSALTGYEPEEVMGKSPSILQGPETDPHVLARLKKNLDDGELFFGKAVNYRKDGSPFLMEWKIAPIRGADNEITHYLAIQQEAF